MSVKEMTNKDLLDALEHEHYESGAEGGRCGSPGPTDNRYRFELERRLLAGELSRLGHVMFGDELEKRLMAPGVRMLERVQSGDEDE